MGINRGLMDQTTFHGQLIIKYSFIIQPGTTVRIPLNLAPAPYLPDGLYNNEDNNLVRITTNTDTCPLQLRNNQPISGVTVQLLNHEDNRKTPKLNKLLRTDSPNQKTQAYHNDPTRKRHKSAASKIQHNHNVDADHPRIKPSLKTKEPNIPGIGYKLTEDPTQKKKNRQHPARPVRYQGHRTGTDPCQQTTNCKSTTHLLDELDVDNTPHYHHRIEQITYRLIHIKQSQETANGRGSRHTISISLTTTRTLIK